MGRFVVLFLFLWVQSAACTSSNPNNPDAGDSGPPPPAEVTFPQGFLWGSATAGFQVESGNQTSDWGHWVELSGKISNGDKPDVGGPDALNHIDDDIKALTDSAQNAYRFSIEWNRMYPTRAAFDADMPDMAAVTAYGTLLSKLKAANITPMVTLSHFALPDYLADVTKTDQPYGWENQITVDLFAQYCSRMAKRFAGDVEYWVTINEPLNVIAGGYVQGSFPPGLVLKMDRGLVAAKNEARAHVKCFDAIHASDPTAKVSFAAHLRTFTPLDPEAPEDVAAAQRVKYLFNQWFLNVVARGDWDDDYDGKYDGPNDKKGDASLTNRLDWIGVNYYGDKLVSYTKGIRAPVIEAAVIADHMPTDRPKTDFAWDIVPEGFGTVLDEAAAYKLPILITENGIADRSDKNRARFIAEHLYQLGWAKQRGADIRGYFHWALVDNFEWANGFCPKFGLYAVDPQTRARLGRSSIVTFKGVILSGKVRRSDVDALPPYSAPVYCQ